MDLVRVAPASHLTLAEDAITERVASGRLRDYGFARKPASSLTHPELVISGAKSIIAAAVSYFASDAEEPALGLRGRIARFARGRDYHDILEERLRRLGDWLCAESGGEYMVCVDTGPVIDRAISQIAGIGSYGRNNAIITPEFGSWVVLGELITTVELEPDLPLPLEQCGNCSMCINACPSGAIISPFVVDQTKCISHLTQMKGSIPVELRPLLGNRIYGCDVCQEVCPKNAHIGCGDYPMDGGLGGNPELLPLLNISDDDYRRIISPTAISWIGRSRFRRNVAVALGNIGDSLALPELLIAIDDTDLLVREHATWAIERCR